MLILVDLISQEIVEIEMIIMINHVITNVTDKETRVVNKVIEMVAKDKIVEMVHHNIRMRM